MSATVRDALVALRPGAQWALVGDVLTWLDTTQTQPTQTEIDNKIAELDAAAAAEVTRQSGINADSNLQQLLTQAKTSSVAQIDTWIANNVTTLAQARTVLAAIIKWIAMQG
jgi:hypothetical protein